MILFDVSCYTYIDGFKDVEYTTNSLAAAIQICRAYYHEIELKKEDCTGKNKFEEWLKELPAFFDIDENYACEEDFACFVSHEGRVSFEISVYISVSVEADIPALVKEALYE